ncbi:MAG: serine protease, partial [Chromatiaceae bacterium]
MIGGASILAFLLFWMPAWASAQSQPDALNAVTARVLCLPTRGDPQTGSGIVIDGGNHLVTNWHLVACSQEGGQALVLLNADTREQVAAVVRERYETQDLAILKLARRLDRPEARFATLATLRQGDP